MEVGAERGEGAHVGGEFDAVHDAEDAKGGAEVVGGEVGLHEEFVVEGQEGGAAGG